MATPLVRLPEWSAAVAGREVMGAGPSASPPSIAGCRHCGLRGYAGANAACRRCGDGGCQG